MASIVISNKKDYLEWFFIDLEWLEIYKDTVVINFPNSVTKEYSRKSYSATVTADLFEWHIPML